MRRRARGLIAIAAGIALAATVATGEATAQVTSPATVTSVPDGDTLMARTADGRDLVVRLIGIDAPEPTECGGADARTELRRLVDGQAVALETDPAVEPIDGFGRSWMYVDRGDGLDVGREMVRRGWAAVVEDPPFARLTPYLDAQNAASQGVWSSCDGDFHLTPAEQRRALARAARTTVQRYYRRLSNDRYRTAWNMLGTPVKRKLGYGFRQWRSSFRGSLSVVARTTGARVRGDRARVTVRLRSRDRDICNGRSVTQRFRGTVVLANRGNTLTIVRFRIRKTTGGTPRLSKSQCPPPPRPRRPSSPPADCQGYDPCLPPGPDVDCAGGSGDGPRYTGPVRVTGSDPYGLDSDGDGFGCET